MVAKALRKGRWKMPWYVVSNIGVGAENATCHSDKRFGSRARQDLLYTMLSHLLDQQ